MEQVAHGVDEDPAGLAPAIRDVEGVGMASDDAVEVPLVSVIEDREALVLRLFHVAEPP